MEEKPEVWGRKKIKKRGSHGWKDVGMHEGGPGGGLGDSTLPCIRASLGVQHCKHPKCLETTGRQGFISISMQNRKKQSEKYEQTGGHTQHVQAQLHTCTSVPQHEHRK